ncbi:DinB family protein [Nakamurella sp.]|uniref:DinB family protein n=1 Tax=Nakamurella sp. TaxID=1869182 RepID=UPI0037837AF9
MTSTETTETRTLSQERQDLLEALQTQRYFLKFTAQGLTDEQARLTPTASALSIGGLIKHVSATEQGWYDFATGAPESMAGGDNAEADYADGFRLREDETLADVLAAYDTVAARTDELAATADLDVAYPLPPAPWFAPGATRSVRRVLIHLVGETAQHAGHADIIRETIDGQKTMG